MDQELNSAGSADCDAVVFARNPCHGNSGEFHVESERSPIEREQCKTVFVDGNRPGIPNGSAEDRSFGSATAVKGLPSGDMSF